MINILYYKTGFDMEYEKKYLLQAGYKDIHLFHIDEEDTESIIEAGNRVKADALVIVYEKVTREVMKQIKTLKQVSIPSIGYNNIDIEAAKELGIRVTHLSSYCEVEVAEHTLGLAIDLSRKITIFDRDVRKGEWEYNKDYPPFRISGQTFGLVFFGKIPKRMVPMLKGFNMKILVYAPSKSKEEIEAYGCQKAETLEELLGKADYVSLHAPLNEETFHMIGKKELACMKSTAFLINTARGSIVDENALYEAVKTGIIKGAGVDVIEDEEHGISKLSELSHTIITPHVAFFSEGSLKESRRKVLQNVITWCVEKNIPEDTVV